MIPSYFIYDPSSITGAGVKNKSVKCQLPLLAFSRTGSFSSLYCLCHLSLDPET